MTVLYIILLTILQNASFTLVSRARNSDSLSFHALASVLSNGIWFLVFRELTLNIQNNWIMAGYISGAVTGSLLMHHISMKYLEPWFKKRQVLKTAA